SKEVNLTLEKFGQRIGVGKSTISDIENGRRNLTEQMTKSICREFGVDYVWFTTGDGEMFVETDDDFMETIDRIMIGENEFHKNLFKALAHLDENELFALEHILDKVINFTKGDIDE
ncbi:MAG: helix-turn-helix transcriptional regulator, partial [Lachnospiraceae bacterium]